MDEHRRDGDAAGGHFDDCPGTATKAPARPAAGPPTPRRSAAGKTRPPASTLSPTHITWDDVRRWYSDKLSVPFRAAVFLVTLVGVATVPILIVVYRGRAIGWLMTVVFHQSGPEKPSSHQQHRRHDFFLLNYAYTDELNNWKTFVAAASATFVQLTAIVAVHRGYSAVAEWLTKYSYRSVYDPRFQSRYTALMSCFDSANYYSSLVYIAFFKVRQNYNVLPVLLQYDTHELQAQ